MNIAKHRSNGPGTETLCPWQTLSGSGLVVSRRGLILAGYYATPPDAASSTLDEREDLVRRVNDGLLNFGSGTALWTDVVVVPASDYPAPELSYFPDPVSRAIDEERRRAFQAEGAHFESDRAIVIAYQPPSAAANRVAGMMYSRGGDAQAGPMAEAETTFRKMLDRFEAACGDVLRLRRMQSFPVLDPITEREGRSDELVNYLYYCLTGRTATIRLPDARLPLPFVLAADFEPGDTPVVNNEYVTCVTIDGFPGESFPGVTDALSLLPFPYRFTQRFIPYDEAEAQRKLEAKRKFWRQRMHPFFATIFGLTGGAPNRDAVKMHDACVESMGLSKSGEVNHGWYNATVVLRHRDPVALDAMRQAVETIMFRLYFTPRTETVNAPDAFLGTLPGNLGNNVRRPMLHTYNLADLSPNSAVWSGRAENPNPMLPPGSPALMYARTEGSIPFRFNTHVGDNGNFAKFGPPGSGKTTALNAICLQHLRYPRAAVRSIDYKRGMKGSCLAVGGSYHEIGGGTEPVFCPFEHLETALDRSLAQEWTEAVFHLQHGKPPSSHQRTEIIHRMLEMLKARPVRSITTAIMLCHDHEVAEALRYYSLDGPAGYLFDAESTEVAETHWDAYDVTDILGAGDKVLLPVLMCLEARFDRIRDGRPILETTDEAWAAMSHPIWRPRLRNRWKTSRSFNVSIGIATQNLADMPEELVAIILENVPTLVFGANPKADQGGRGDERGPADFYKAVGLNAKQREIIKRLRKAREYYIVSPEGARDVDFGFGPLMLSIAGATSKEAVEHITSLQRQHGDRWLDAYLTEKGIDHAPLLAV